MHVVCVCLCVQINVCDFTMLLKEKSTIPHAVLSTSHIIIIIVMVVGIGVHNNV